MANGTETDAAGNFHGEDGKYVSLRSYVERIFDEREKGAEFARLQLERALIEARVTTERAMQEAKTTVDTRLVEAKTAADGVNADIVKRLDNLESGGAPFASRLDDGMTNLKLDVEKLKAEAVRVAALDELRKANTAAIEQQRKQIRLAVFAAVINFGLGVILVGIQLLR